VYCGVTSQYVVVISVNVGIIYVYVAVIHFNTHANEDNACAYKPLHQRSFLLLTKNIQDVVYLEKACEVIPRAAICHGTLLVLIKSIH
jgi:hypothetical protein